MGNNNGEVIFQCPAMDLYHFKNECSITTCQHYTEKTDRCCLMLDRSAGDVRSFTDKELCFYKFDGKASLREVSTKRRTSVNAIKNITALYRYVDYIKNHFSGRDSNFSVDPELESLISISHLRFNKIQFSIWMLPYLLSEGTLQKFKTKEGIPSDITLATMIHLTKSEFATFLDLARKSLPK